MRRTNHRPAFLSALAAGQGFARVIVVVLASVYRYHSRGIARVGESKIVRAPFDEHHKQKCHRQYDVEFPLRCLRTAFEHKYVNTQCNNQGFQFSRGVSSEFNLQLATVSASCVFVTEYKLKLEL